MSTPMEKIKAFHGIKSFLNNEEKQKVSDMLNLTESDLTIRQFGKDKEFEFILLVVSLNQIKDLIAFEEGISRLTNTVTTDLLLILKNNKRIVIEIKSTQGTKIPIKKDMLEDKKKFASIMNAELYFALNIHGLWMLLSAEQIENSLSVEEKSKGKKNYSIDIRYYPRSRMYELGEKNYIIVNEITFESTYIKDSGINSDWIVHPDYGDLVDYKVKMGEVLVSHFLRTTIGKEKLILFEILQDEASKNFQEIDVVDNKTTTIIEKSPHKLHITLSSFLLAPIQHIINDFEEGYDYVQFVTKIIDESGYGLYRPKNVLSLIDHFKACGAFIIELSTAENK